jgi:hypothetical protein
MSFAAINPCVASQVFVVVIVVVIIYFVINSVCKLLDIPPYSVLEAGRHFSVPTLVSSSSLLLLGCYTFPATSWMFHHRH